MFSKFPKIRTKKILRSLSNDKKYSTSLKDLKCLNEKNYNQKYCHLQCLRLIIKELLGCDFRLNPDKIKLNY